MSRTGRSAGRCRTAMPSALRVKFPLSFLPPHPALIYIRGRVWANTDTRIGTRVRRREADIRFEESTRMNLALVESLDDCVTVEDCLGPGDLEWCFAAPGIDGLDDGPPGGAEAGETAEGWWIAGRMAETVDGGQPTVDGGAPWEFPPTQSGESWLEFPSPDSQALFYT